MFVDVYRRKNLAAHMETCKVSGPRKISMTRRYNDQPYRDRETRNRFIVEHLFEYIGNSVLSVGGGGERRLAKYLPEDTYYKEIDKAGHPDIRLDLESDLPVPIGNRSFDTVICTDVLEHLENIHAVFTELVRISRKFIIISLPNPAFHLRYYMLDRHERSLNPAIQPEYGRYLKFYGLPLVPPSDRHKWFYGYVEAEIWIQSQAETHNLELAEYFGIGYRTKRFWGQIIRWAAGFFLGDAVRKNLFCTALWCVLEVKSYSRPNQANHGLPYGHDYPQ
jgi:hypothetical protein